MSFVLSHWMAGAALVLGWVGGRLRLPRRKRAAASAARLVWAPEVAEARQSAWDYRFGSDTPKDDMVAVRLRKDKTRTLLIGVVPVAAGDFEDQLRKLTAAAEEKAAAMNAAELEVAA